MLTEDSEHIYHRLSSLRNQKHNVLLLLSWSFTYHDQILEVLSDWAKSKESLKLYQRLIEDLWLQQTSEEFTLILAALLCRERLLSYAMNNIAQSIEDSYLTDFDAILNAQDFSNRRVVFEQMLLSLLRVLCTLEDSENLLEFLAKILDKESSLLTSLDDISNQYCVRKIHEHTHNKAFEKVREGLLKFVMTMLKRDMNADVEWTIISRLSLKLVSAL